MHPTGADPTDLSNEELFHMSRVCVCCGSHPHQICALRSGENAQIGSLSADLQCPQRIQHDNTLAPSLTTTWLQNVCPAPSRSGPIHNGLCKNWGRHDRWHWGAHGDYRRREIRSRALQNYVMFTPTCTASTVLRFGLQRLIYVTGSNFNGHLYKSQRYQGKRLRRQINKIWRPYDQHEASVLLAAKLSLSSCHRCS